MTLFEKIVAGLAQKLKTEFVCKDIHKVLVANRGTCAELLASACERNKVPVVIACTEEDYNKFAFLREGKQSKRFELAIIKKEPGSKIDPYMDVKGMIKAAKASDCDAIIPGWGFLSEKSEFPKACESEGIHFVGPKEGSMRLLGDKDAAKQLARKAKVSISKGVEQEAQEPIERFAERIKAAGLKHPVLAKAVAGGGGGGQRLILSEKDLVTQLKSAETEGASTFGNGKLLVEEFIRNARHVEIQVARDKHGNAFALNERECSVQRRNQKVIEESLAPRVSDLGASDDPRVPNKTRQEMCDEAIALAHAAKYEGVGTVEFLVDDDGNKYFLEMNTRLQVEHPVTNMVHFAPDGSRLDLVDVMLRIENGDSIEYLAGYQQRGHAIEVRVLAEDLGNTATFGELWNLVMPESRDDLLVECSYKPGDSVSGNYDSMLGKIIVWGEDRADAIKKLIVAVESIQVESQDVRVNKEQLLALLRSDKFQSGQMKTDTIKYEPGVMAVDLGKTETRQDQIDKTALYLAKMATEELIPVPGRQDGKQFDRKLPDTDYHLDQADPFRTEERKALWEEPARKLQAFCTACTEIELSDFKAETDRLKAPLSAFFAKLDTEAELTAWHEVFVAIGNGLKAQDPNWTELFDIMSTGVFNWKAINKLGPEQVNFAIHVYTKVNNAALMTIIEGRDGQQSRIQDRIEGRLLAQLYSQMHEVVGDSVFSVESDGGAVPDVQTRFLGNMAFTWSDKIDQATNTQLTQMLLRAMNAVAYGNIPLNLLSEIVSKFKEHGVHIYRIFDCLNNISATQKGSKAVKEAGGISQVAISFTVDDLSTPVEEKRYDLTYWKKRCDAIIHEAQPHQLAFKDMASQLTPQMVGDLTSYLVKTYPLLVLSLHPHNDSHMAAEVTKAFIQAGGHIHDCGFAGTHTTVEDADFDGRLKERGVNPSGIQKMRTAWERTFAYYEPFSVPPLDPFLALISQIPGGQWPNFHTQAVSNNVSFGPEAGVKSPWIFDSLFEDIKALKTRFAVDELPEECKWVYAVNKPEDIRGKVDPGQAFIVFAYRVSRFLMGAVPEVTPSSKVAGEIAIFLTKVKSEEDVCVLQQLAEESGNQPMTPHALFKWLEQELLKNPKKILFPTSALKYFQKDLGMPDAFPKFREALLAAYDLKEFADELPDYDLDAAQREIEEKTGQKATREDVVFYGMFGDVYIGVMQNRHQYGPTASLVPPHVFFDGLEIDEDLVIQPTAPDKPGVDAEIEGPIKEAHIQLKSRDVVEHDSGAKDFTIVMMVDGVERTYKFHTNPKANGPNEVGAEGNGKLLELRVKEGDVIQEEGQVLSVMSVMKMSTEIKATADMVGKRVKSINDHLVGQMLQKNDQLITLE